MLLGLVAVEIQAYSNFTICRAVLEKPRERWRFDNRLDRASDPERGFSTLYWFCSGGSNTDTLSQRSYWAQLSMQQLRDK